MARTLSLFLLGCLCSDAFVLNCLHKVENTHKVSLADVNCQRQRFMFRPARMAFSGISGGTNPRTDTVEHLLSVLASKDTNERQAVQALKDASAKYDLSETEWDIILRRFPGLMPGLTSDAPSENVSNHPRLHLRRAIFASTAV